MSLLKRFWYEEEGIGVVEIVLILMILLGLVVIFKDQIAEIFDKAIKSIQSSSDSLIK